MMQGFINQITSMIAEQSYKSIENNNLADNLSGEQHFNGIFQGLVIPMNQANIAAMNGQVLPPQQSLETSPHLNQVIINIHSHSPQIDLSLRNIPTDHHRLDNDLVNANTNKEFINSTLSAEKVHRDHIPVKETAIKSIDDLAVQKSVNTKTALGHDAEIYINNANDIALGKSKHETGTYEIRGLKELVNKNNFPVSHVINAETDTAQSTNTISSKPTIDVNETINNMSIKHAKSKSSSLNGRELAVDEMSQSVNGLKNNFNSFNTHTAELDKSNVISQNVNTDIAKNVSSNSIMFGNEAIKEKQGNNEYEREWHLNNQVISRQAGESKSNNSSSIKSASELDQNAITVSTMQGDNVRRSVQPVHTEKFEGTFSANKPVHALIDNNELNRSDINYRNDRVQVNYTANESFPMQDNKVLVTQYGQNNHIELDNTTALNKGYESMPDLKSVSTQIVSDKSLVNPLTNESLGLTNKMSGIEKSSLHNSVDTQLQNGDEVAQQITWAKNNNTQHVKLSLAPDHLGALEISIEKDRDGLNIQFTTQNASAKEAIETFMPRLKDLLEQQGLNLQNTNVSQQGGNHSSESYKQAFKELQGDIPHDENIPSGNQSEISNQSQVQNYLIEAFA